MVIRLVWVGELVVLRMNSGMVIIDRCVLISDVLYVVSRIVIGCWFIVGFLGVGRFGAVW